MRSVAVFTDTYLPTVNGVTYTVKAWRDCWADRGGRMDVVYPRTDGYAARVGEYPVRSLPFPFYPGFRIGIPWIPRRVRDVDIVHAHTPFAVGLAGLRLARTRDCPFVASYHTPTAEYADYVAPGDAVETLLERGSERYERWFLDRADAILAPSDATAAHLTDEVGVETPVTVIPNGIDTERFRPVDAEAFRARHGLDDADTLIGYTGRHGYEKRLGDLVDAAAELDATVVFGGDGPARSELEQRAVERGVDARFLGFLDREELPAFYSALDAFVFPSPVETQGLVALEANACGTPVVGANDGALADTVEDGVTGYHFETGDVASLRQSIRRTLAERDELRRSCLDRRERHGVDRAVDRLTDVYERLS
ncbi:glycosyltransferase family 4 protein [Haloplanus aerogenes]|uniref:Glycosyltransferase family 4 protein n=1 Tax=Haloplanus aerogenes TaxID=660522 RepID=A0A3M0D3N7_9EURY|nr:glycosyltransferase family 4 protein [Haloplanus aerogenes]AZH24974.1 glycosyltransferase family 4 protein [Haloplanus aerogenes]RMB13809.1 glycosyltransferase involved in cell wall biosynthesis [Haloplanus aerogenes]